MSLHGKENFENRLLDILNILLHCLKTVEANPLKTVYAKTTIESVNDQIFARFGTNACHGRMRKLLNCIKH